MVELVPWFVAAIC